MVNKSFFRNAKYSHGEPKDHYQCKQWIREIAKAHGYAVQEEVYRPVDLHDVLPELYAEKSMRNYQLDLLLSRRIGKDIREIGVEIDGMSHADKKRKEKDAIRDIAIPAKYGHPVVRFDKEAMMAGDITEEQIVEKLGL